MKHIASAGLLLVVTAIFAVPPSNARASNQDMTHAQGNLSKFDLTQLDMGDLEPSAQSTADAVPLSNNDCSVVEKGENWFIKGNCKVSCYNGYKCVIDGPGPGGDEGYCKVKHTWAKNAEIVGNCPHHTVMCTITTTNVECVGGE